MTSSQFVKEIATEYHEAGVTQKELRKYCNIIEAGIKEYLGRGEDVKVCDINFKVQDVPPTRRRNPATGNVFECPATKRLKMKPSSDLKSVVKNGTSEE